ncbi:MAG: RHS repeat-associated core domain-containing protein, partial [Candidatus Omnitrophota bacterium]|nr:RHS repeat-associated core domain-containing protein [Candidatus Omnitrophota bacterium]
SGNITEVTEFTSDGVFKTQYEYDIQNNLTKTTDNQGNSTQIFYDSIGRKLKMVDPDMGTWSYEYDALGNLIKQTDAKGQVLEFTYDALNRLIRKQGLSPLAPPLNLTLNKDTTPAQNLSAPKKLASSLKSFFLSVAEASPIPVEASHSVLATYIYDDPSKSNCIGRLSKVIDQSGQTEFFYDKLGREIKSIKEVSGVKYQVLREYDELDRLTKLTYPDGETVTYTYDVNSGSLEKVQGTSIYVQDISYNAKGQIKTISYGNGTHTDYTYGLDLRLSHILTQGSATLQDLLYTFDKNGNLSELTDNLRNLGTPRKYTYDDLDRLIRAEDTPAPDGGFTTFNYRYDSIGNMVYKSDLGVMTYGSTAGPHALTRAGGYTYQYDANGNMTQGKNKTLSYDAENRLTEVNELGRITSFTYDGDGGRVSKMAKGLPPSKSEGTVPDSVTTYIGSLFEIDFSGKATKHIFAGENRVATHILRASGEAASREEVLYYHSDHLGSSNVITDATGNLAQYCEYTPYGTLARNEGTDVAKHKFTGKELDETGLYYYSARYYDPEIAHFITPDTIVQAPYDPQSLNRYSYCRNNPINYVDPSGHEFLTMLIWTLIVIAAGWGLAQTGMAEVNVEGKASVPFDTGPSQNNSPSSSNPASSNPGEEEDTVASPSEEGKENGNTSNPTLPPETGRRQTGTPFIPTNYPSSPIFSPWVQIPLSGIPKGGSAYASIWQDTIKGDPHTAGWTKGIGYYNRLQSIYQAAGVVQSSLYYRNLYEKAAAQSLSQPQITASSTIHGAGVGVGMLATEGGKWAGRAGGAALFAKFGIGGATVGGVVGAVAGGILAAVVISFMEKRLNESMGIK